MVNNPPYNPDPEDLKLARLLDRQTESAAPTGKEDPLLPFLENYKSSSQLKVRHGNGLKLYRNLEDKLGGSDTARLLKLHPAYRRVAALFLIGALLILFYLMADLGQPVLLAESSGRAVEQTLADGSAVTLRPYSAIYKVVESEAEQRYFIRGEAYFDVAEAADRQFYVMTDDAMITVTGTSFAMRSWGDRTRVFLQSGSVLFSTTDGRQQVELVPGQFSHTVNGQLAPPQPAVEEVYLGWLRDELVMESRPLSEVAEEISHHFNITIAVPTGHENEELGGKLPLDDPERILQDIALSVGLQLEKVDEGHFRFVEFD